MRDTRLTRIRSRIHPQSWKRRSPPFLFLVLVARRSELFAGWTVEIRWRGATIAANFVDPAEQEILQRPFHQDRSIAVVPRIGLCRAEFDYDRSGSFRRALNLFLRRCAPLLLSLLAVPPLLRSAPLAIRGHRFARAG